MSIVHILLVGIGGAFGAIARYVVSQVINKKSSSPFPIATLLINLIGSFFLGLIIGLGINDSALLLIGTGFMGAFTTFSTFKFEGTQLIMNKRKKEFIIYNIVSYSGGILLAYIGTGPLSHFYL